MNEAPTICCANPHCRRKLVFRMARATGWVPVGKHCPQCSTLANAARALAARNAAQAQKGKVK